MSSSVDELIISSAGWCNSVFTSPCTIFHSYVHTFSDTHSAVTQLTSIGLPLTFIRYPRLLSLKTSLRNTMSSLWLASGRSWEVSRASVSCSPTTGGRNHSGVDQNMSRWSTASCGQCVCSICASPAPAVSTGMASFMGQQGEGRGWTWQEETADEIIVWAISLTLVNRAVQNLRISLQSESEVK